MEMESSMVQEAAKVEESDKKIDPEPMKSEDSEEEADHTNVLALDMKDPVEEPNPTRVLALDMILKSLSKISVFLSDLLLEFCQETHHSLTEDGEYVVPPLSQLRGFLVNNLSVAHPLEPNDVFDFLVAILELLPLWRSGNEPLNSKFEVYEVAKKKCNRCRLDIECPVECSYGLLLDANSLREIKSAFKDMTFENVLKVIRITLMMPCDKEGCGKRNYVERMIDKLPPVFTIALEWENNETKEEILATTSVMATEIDISEIYKYEGDSIFTKYHLVSMVCCHGDQYSCIAYERGSWVIYFGSENEVIGEWSSVLSMFLKRNIRPKILFFENVSSYDYDYEWSSVLNSTNLKCRLYGGARLWVQARLCREENGHMQYYRMV